jgi:hypothetical protein
MTDDAEPTELAAVETETESVRAWGLDEGEDDPPTTRLTPRRITAAAVMTSLAAAVAAGVVALVYLDNEESAPTAAPPAATAGQPTTAAPSLPNPASPEPLPPPAELQGIDGKFVAEMRGFGVPISDEDPGWTTDLAHAVCATAQDGGRDRYPPGTFTVNMLTKGVMENNADWTRQQASRFTNGAVNYYCPDVWGPSQRKIAAMPPDDRYLAMLQDRLGITPVDDSLVRVGHQVCAWKEQGWWNDKIVDAINSPNPRDDEQVMVEMAIDVYCPQYSGR